MPEFFGQLPTTERPWTSLGDIQSIEQDTQGLTCDCGDGARLRLSILAPNLVRVRVSPTGNFMPHRSWSTARADEEWEPLSFEVQESEEQITVETDQMRVCIQRRPCRIACFDREGRPFAQDAEGSVGWRSAVLPEGESVSCQIAGWKHIEAGERFYGFGERTGLLDKHYEIKTNWTFDSLDYNSLTDEMYQAIPFFIALRPQVAYGLFFNTTFWSRFDMGVSQPDVWRMETEGKDLDYYIIYGAEPAPILQTYTQLTGRMPLPPRWSLGYHQCRWSYDSEKEVRQLAHEFRQRQIPCDVIHLDIDYMRGFRVFTWTKHRFPDPAAMIRDLKAEGFKTITIVDPGVKYDPEADYEVLDQGIEQDYFVRRADGKVFHGYVWPDRAVFPDFVRPDVRQWWGDWHHRLTDAGVAGIWNDMNEPAMNNRPFGDPGHKIWFPMDAPQGPADERTTHAETHNLYGLLMARAAAEGMERLRPNQRSFILTRSGFAGVQRWSSVWTGDNQSQWEYLEMSIPMLCNLGLSGVAFVGADIGGFAGNATPELFARWMQVGMLYPMMRAHSMIGTERHEPWVFGDRTERICREYIELRYQLLPYLYTLFWEAATTGAPILRPLLYHYSNDPQTHHLYDQVMLGPSLMAAPVYRPGVTHRSVYLPEGAWYDWWTGEKQEGDRFILAAAPLERMPIYIRAGSFIPMAPVMQYVDERPMEELHLRVFPGTGEWTLYEDDGQSFDYRQGASATTTYRVYPEGAQMVVEVGDRQGQWQPHPRRLKVELVGIGEQEFADDGTAKRLVF